MTLRLVRPLCAMASAKSDGLDRLGKISELVGDHDTGIALGGNQASEEPLCGFGVAAGLNENVENGAVGNEVGNVMTPGFPSRGSGSTWQSPAPTSAAVLSGKCISMRRFSAPSAMDRDDTLLPGT